MMRAPLTAEQRDKAQERSQERYERIYSEVEAEARAEWYAEFGECIQRFPFAPNAPFIHREARRRVELEQRHEAEDRAEYVASGLY